MTWAEEIELLRNIAIVALVLWLASKWPEPKPKSSTVPREGLRGWLYEMSFKIGKPRPWREPMDLGRLFLNLLWVGVGALWIGRWLSQ
jgi:hypothetical protein